MRPSEGVSVPDRNPGECLATQTPTRDVAAPSREAAAPSRSTLERYARDALAEDLGGGDVTTTALVPAATRATATLVARDAGTLCGLVLAREVFLALDPDLRIDDIARDGDPVAAGASLMTITGEARPILSAERVALNFLGRLSGIATLTRRFVDAVDGTGATILDTRKTNPGLRVLERWAVRCGGGTNHRFDLSDGFMLKDNHRAALAAAGIDPVRAVRESRPGLGDGLLVTIEVDELTQVPAALDAGADVILLDNMSPALLAEAVARIRPRALTEASGGITLESVRRVAESGVDRISVGALTHSAAALDVALDFEWEHDL